MIRRTLARGLIVGVVLGVVAALGLPTAALADTEPAATPTPAPAATPEASPAATPTPTEPPLATALSITAPTKAAFIPSGWVKVTGTRTAADKVQVQVVSPATQQPACIIAPDGTTTWSCVVNAVASGPKIVIQATEIAADGSTKRATVTIASLAPPTVTGPKLTGGLISGISAYPGATVNVAASNAKSSRCAAVADASGIWACVLNPVPASGKYTVSATQDASFAPSPSNASKAFPITIDSTAPAAPTITSPHGSTTVRDGTRITFRGTGETGALVTVYAGSPTEPSTNLCTASVANGAWRCVGIALPSGSYSVSALQRDDAGNSSPASATLALAFSAPAATKPTHPSEPGESAPSRSPHHSTKPAPTPTSPSPNPTPKSTPAPAPAPAPMIPPSSGGIHHFESTPFTAAVQSAVGPQAFPGWLRSLLLAVACLLLLLLPARILAGTIGGYRGGKPKRMPLRLIGRNQPRGSAEPGSISRLVGVVGLLAAAAVMALAAGDVSDEFAYLRMLGAVVAAVTVINAVVVFAPRLVSRRMPSARASAFFAPRTLWLVVATTAASRLFDLHPALLFGVVFGIAIAAGAGVVQRGKIAATQTGALAALGLIFWIVLGLLPGPTGGVGAFLSEFANALVLGAMGSSAILLIPVGRMPGRAIFTWSRIVWLGMMVAVYTMLFALLIPADAVWQHGFGTFVAALLAVGFAVVSISLWLWRRYVTPNLS